MAAGMLPAPGSKHPRTGEEIGPCVDTGCGHIDCEGTRAMASLPCRYCRKPIGYDAGYYKEEPKEGERGLWTDHTGKRWALAHAPCLELAIEDRPDPDIRPGGKHHGDPWCDPAAR